MRGSGGPHDRTGRPEAEVGRRLMEHMDQEPQEPGLFQKQNQTNYLGSRWRPVSGGGARETGRANMEQSIMIHMYENAPPHTHTPFVL